MKTLDNVLMSINLAIKYPYVVIPAKAGIQK